MDPIQNEESRTEPKMESRRRKRRKRVSIPIPAFLTRLGEDVRWYYDIRLWSPLILVLLIAMLKMAIRRKEEKNKVFPVHFKACTYCISI